MAKPIFIIKYPTAVLGTISEINDWAKKEFSDYHTFAVPNPDDDWKFEMFNSENIPEIEIEELKQKVISQFSKE